MASAQWSGRAIVARVYQHGPVVGRRASGSLGRDGRSYGTNGSRGCREPSSKDADRRPTLPNRRSNQRILLTIADGEAKHEMAAVDAGLGSFLFAEPSHQPPPEPEKRRVADAAHERLAVGELPFLLLLPGRQGIANSRYEAKALRKLTT